MMLIHLVAGARPNFMKIAPLWHALASESWTSVEVVHTDQHYDDAMSGAFLRDLRLPAPHMHLGVGSGTHAQQTAAVMVQYEEHCRRRPPDAIVVVGDVNSTMAAALVGAKLRIPVAHLEAGLRSFDRTMPEEINRIVTDRVADFLWTPSQDADENLIREGVPPGQIERVGNIMIDSFEMLRATIEGTPPAVDRDHVLVTLHRPHNVDDPDRLRDLIEALTELASETDVLFPVHPRTKQNLETYGLLESVEASPITMHEPLGYVQFMATVLRANLVITDSGGIQEETTYLGIPCITVRPNTERPITVTHGTNALAEPGQLSRIASKRLAERQQPIAPIPFWDGKTAGRVVDSLRRHLSSRR